LTEDGLPRAAAATRVGRGRGRGFLNAKLPTRTRVVVPEDSPEPAPSANQLKLASASSRVDQDQSSPTDVDVAPALVVPAGLQSSGAADAVLPPGNGQVQSSPEPQAPVVQKKLSVKFAPDVQDNSSSREREGGNARAQTGGWEPPAATGWERSFRRDDDMLRASGLWCKKVEADGACLFRAFSDQLEGDGGAGHIEFRRKCVEYLEAHEAEYAPFVEGSFNTYLSRMMEPSEWAGHTEVEALSKTLGVNIIIHRPAEANSPEEARKLALEVINFDENAPCVQVCYHPRYHAGPHYNSVRCLGDDGSGQPIVRTITEMREICEDALAPFGDSP